MPFTSRAQERFMYANHPEIAKRWQSEFGSFKSEGEKGTRQKTIPGSNVNPRKDTSEESPNPRVAKLPRPGGFARDFGKLRPSSSARFKPKSRPAPNLAEADKESSVQFITHSRHSELGKPTSPKGFARRDHQAAHRGPSK